MESDKSKLDLENQKKISKKWLNRCVLTMFILAFIQHYIAVSAIQTTVGAFAESFGYAIPSGLVLGVILWLLWKVLANFFPVLKK